MESFFRKKHDKNDSILYIILHKYDSKGREEETDRLEWSKGKMKTAGRTVFVYDKAGNKIVINESGMQEKAFPGNQLYLFFTIRLFRNKARQKRHLIIL